jgi:hypothetical protein
MALSHYKDWLEEYIYYTSGHEVPQLYNKWVGIGLIASVLKQNVYLPMFTYDLYPNMFIVIVDEASSGKSHAIERFGLSLLMRADEKDPSGNMYIYNQRITAAAMIKSMSELYKTKNENCVCVIAEELGFFTDMSGDNMNISNVLIKTYDNGLLASETIARSLDMTPKAQLNIIGATTPGSLKKSVGKQFLESGALSRMMFVHSTEPFTPMPFPKPPKENDTRKEYLADELNDFKNLSGKFKWSAEARDYYEKWYYKTCDNLEDIKDKQLVKRMSGKMLKIAMVLSVARKHNMILELNDVIDAIGIRNEAMNNYLYIENKLVTNEWGEKTQSILDIIKANKKLTHSELLRKVHHFMGLSELASAISTLEESDLIEVRSELSKNAKKPTKIYVYRG